MRYLKWVALLVILLLVLVVGLCYWPRDSQQQVYLQKGYSWQYCKSLPFASCSEPRLLDWKQALRYCAQLSWAGYHDWRLPERSVLLGIVDRKKRTPAVTSPLDKDTKDNVYWSSSTDMLSPELAYYISFFSGNSYANSKQVEAYVRCVR